MLQKRDRFGNQLMMLVSEEEIYWRINATKER